MELLTLIKANIRYKKGSFVSIIILMLIISMSFTAIFSIKDNCINSIENALDSVNTGDLTSLIDNHTLTDELIDSVEKHSLVEDTIVKEAILTFGSEFGETKDLNSWLMLRLTDEYRLLNEDLSDYADKTPALKKGEIYVTQGIGTKFGCDIGDKIKITTVGSVVEFTIKGFIVEPLCGCMNVGAKQVFISDEDFALLQQEAIDSTTDQQNADFRVLQIYKADKTIGDDQFKQQLNEDTGVVDYSLFAFTKSQSFYYTNIYPDILLSGLLVFVVFLVSIVLIVMAHSISTSIEMEYTSLGMLKAQGFTENKIKMIFVVQYLFAEVVGAIFGIALALPLIKYFGDIFQPILAIPCKNNVSILVSLIFIVSVLVVSVSFVFIAARKVGRISPVKAISGGKNDIYFASRLNAPISKKALSSSLALRQFTSNKRRYIGIIVIVTILVFFMITMNVMGSSFDSKSSMESMGVPMVELSVNANESISDETVEDIESIVESYTEIENKYYFSNMYMSLNGNKYACVVYKNPETMLMTEGRYPKYDNEIAITDFLSKELDLKIGDKVTVSNKNLESECVVTGIHIYANDLGLNFAMPLEAAKKLDVSDTCYYGFSLADASKCSAIAKEINDKYSKILTVTANESDPTLELYTIAGDAMTAIIYVISIVFSMVVVMMFCTKAFLQERRDIGIYKSLGFTSRKLRLQFAVRFLIVSLIGSALGSVLSLFITENMLTAVFRLTGINSVKAQFSAMSFVVPVAIIAISFFVFSYFASYKINKVETKDLVVE